MQSEVNAYSVTVDQENEGENNVALLRDFFRNCTDCRFLRL